MVLGKHSVARAREEIDCAGAQGRARGGPTHEHRVLTSRISQAPDLDTLAELCAQFGDRFNYINTTAAMHSLALLCAPAHHL